MNIQINLNLPVWGWEWCSLGLYAGGEYIDCEEDCDPVYGGNIILGSGCAGIGEYGTCEGTCFSISICEKKCVRSKQEVYLMGSFF